MEVEEQEMEQGKGEDVLERKFLISWTEIRNQLFGCTERVQRQVLIEKAPIFHITPFELSRSGWIV